MKDPKRFYTYAYLRKDGTPYYIGKGAGKRAYSNLHNVNLPSKEKILFLKTNLLEEEAFKHEIYMIAVLGRKDLGTGILRNLTDGGDGPSGYVYSEEQIKKMSDSRRGKKHPKQSENMMGEKNPMFGKQRTEEVKEQIRQKVLNNNPQRGTFWWNNGKEEIRSKECPDCNWNRGRLTKNRDNTGRFIKK